MGWGNGMAIGWPNATYQQGGPTIYEFTILDCNGAEKQVWSTSSQFLPGAYVFKEPELINPFANDGYWNLAELIYSIGGYAMSGAGEVGDTLTSCPA
jgi:hypothetical protein